MRRATDLGDDIYLYDTTIYYVKVTLVFSCCVIDHETCDRRGLHGGGPRHGYDFYLQVNIYDVIVKGARQCCVFLVALHLQSSKAASWPNGGTRIGRSLVQAQKRAILLYIHCSD